MNRTLILIALLSSVAFSGCTDSGDGGGTDSENEGGPDDKPTGSTSDALTADSSISAPEWNVTEWWHHELFFAADDPGESMYSTVITASGSYVVAPDTRDGAKWDATWGLPNLGTFSTDGLAGEAFQADWAIYDFPLEDGKTWSSTVNTFYGRERDLTFTATFQESLDSPVYGGEPGFLIEGADADGNVELITDYVPSLNWFSQLTFFDAQTADEEDIILRIVTRDHATSSDGEGTYYTGDAEKHVDQPGHCFAPANADGSINDSCGTVSEVTPFTVAEGTDELYGAIFVGALAGHSRVDLGSPAAGSVTTISADSPGMEFDSDLAFIETTDPAAGEWVHDWSGAGMVAVGFTQLWTVTLTEVSLGDGDS